MRGALTSREWYTIAGMASVVIGLHAVGFFILIAVVAPNHFRLRSSGVFHDRARADRLHARLAACLDSDHISAIDNTTRKLMADCKRPLSVGFLFSLGHSTVVFATAFLFAIGIRALGGQVKNAGSTTLCSGKTISKTPRPGDEGISPGAGLLLLTNSRVAPILDRALATEPSAAASRCLDGTPAFDRGSPLPRTAISPLLPATQV